MGKNRTLSNKIEQKNRTLPYKVGSKTLKLNEVHFKILLLLSKFTPQSKIAKILKKGKSTVHFHISKLKNRGYIDSGNELTSRGKQACSIFLRAYDGKAPKILKIRGHDLVFYTKISSVSSVFRDKLKLDGSWIETPMGNWHKYIRHFTDGVKLHVTTKGVQYILPDLLGTNPENVFARALSMVGHHQQWLMNKYGVVLGKPECIAEVQSNHLAFMWDVFANLCAEAGVTFRTDRIHIDKSKGVNELEFVHKKFAKQDARTYMDHLIEVVESDESWKDLVKVKKEFESDKPKVIKLIEIIVERQNTLKSELIKHGLLPGGSK